jgi:DNA-binding GntR family transcriptional regulator
MVQAEHPLPTDFLADLERSSPVPLYYQISTRLERAIHDGHLPAGSRLENEISLAQRFGLSRPTVRRAIQELVDKGLLVRRRGIGTQVVHGQVTRNVELTSLYEDLSRGGQRPTTRLVRLETGTADDGEAEMLGVAVDSPVLRMTRVRFADEVPLAVMHNTLPSDFVDITEDDLNAHGLYQLLRARGVTLRVAKQRIGARAGSSEETTLLELPKHAAVLTMTRTAFDSSGRAVEWGQHCYSPDLYSFEITLVEK